MKLRVCGGLLAVVAMAGCLVSCGPAESAKGPAKSPGPLRAVRVSRVETRAMTRAIAATGTLAAQEQSTLSAKVPGRLQRLLVDLGSVVKQGDLLAEIESRDYELGVRQAEAALGQTRTALGLSAQGDKDQVELDQVSAVKQAKAVLDEATKSQARIQRLLESGISAQAEMDTVEATFKVAQTRYDTAVEEARSRVALLAQRRAEYDVARKKLEDVSLTAPFDGAVQARLASAGEYLSAGTAIIELVKTDPLRLRLQVPERESSLVRTGQVVRLAVEGDTNTYTGVIARLSPALEEQSRMLLVEADVSRQGTLRPGLFARAQIIVAEKEPGLSVSPEALVTFAGLEKVVLVQNGQAVEQVVTTGRRGPGWVEIVSGLGGAEEVVMNPAGLRTGQALTVSRN